MAENNVKCVQARSIAIGSGVPKICMSLTGKTEQELMNHVAAALAAQPDIVEWRVDYCVDILDACLMGELLAKMRRAIQDIPLIFTLRDAAEGGFHPTDPIVRREFYNTAIDSGLIDLADVELQSISDGYADLVVRAKQRSVGVILSYHNFKETPSAAEMAGILQKEQDCGADIAKIAVMPQTRADVLSLLSVGAEVAGSEKQIIPIVAIAMGKLGAVSRVAGGMFGSAMTYTAASMGLGTGAEAGFGAGAEAGSGTGAVAGTGAGTRAAEPALGQIPVEDLRVCMRYFS